MKHARNALGALLIASPLLFLVFRMADRIGWLGVLKAVSLTAGFTLAVLAGCWLLFGRPPK